MTHRPRLALVPGEPAGVGPELCARALQRSWDAELEVFGDSGALLSAASRIGAVNTSPPKPTSAIHDSSPTSTRSNICVRGGNELTSPR